MTHVLYEPSDFTNEELDRGNQLAKLVCEGGLGICKICGAGEADLDDFETCEAYNKHKREERDARSSVPGRR